MKKALFTTEDGVEIFEDTKTNYLLNKLPYVCINGLYLSRCDLKSPLLKQYTEGNSNYKIFSNEEAAKDYIILNKRCISIQNIFDMWKSKGWSGIGIMASYNQENLKDLVKSKLKL